MNDEKASWADLIDKIFGQDNRFMFANYSTLLLVILLLFYKELCPWCQIRLVPALLALSLASALVAHLNGMAIIRKWPPTSEKNTLPAWLFWSFIGFWIFCFLLFLTYIFYIFPPVM